jgi:hypothetical protein
MTIMSTAQLARVTTIDYESFFKQRLDRLYTEGRYHVFATLNAAAAFSRVPMITAFAAK